MDTAYHFLLLSRLHPPISPTISRRIPPDQPFQQRLLQVQPVLGLVPGSGLGAVQDLAGDFLSPVGRQAVQDDGIGPGVLQESAVHLVGGKDLFSRLSLSLLSHRGPDVGIDNVGLLHGPDRIILEINRPPLLAGLLQ